jgi:large subunit ribosomal protein L6
MVKLNISDFVEIPEGVEVSLDETVITVKGKAGEISKDLLSPIIEMKVEEGKVTLKVTKATKREKRLLNTAKAHISNLFKGVTEEYVYKLKICSGHFPMSVNLEGERIIIKNFLGERVPRKAKIIEGSKAEINGEEIIVTSPDKEKAGQTAANIESSTKIRNRDRRRFQDGIYITEKAGVKV